MNLGELRSAIRNTKGNVGVIVPGIGEVLVQKGSLMQALGERYGSKATETNLYLNDAGLLVAVQVQWTDSHVPILEPTANWARTDDEQLDIEDAIAAAADCDDLF